MGIRGGIDELVCGEMYACMGIRRDSHMVAVARRGMRGGGCMHGNKERQPHGGSGTQGDEEMWLNAWE